jgi:hypothetical protein
MDTFQGKFALFLKEKIFIWVLLFRIGEWRINQPFMLYFDLDIRKTSDKSMMYK